MTLYCAADSLTGGTTHGHFPEDVIHNVKQGNLLEELSHTGEIRHGALMCFPCVRSWGWVSALPYCWKSWSVTSCVCLRRVGGRGRGGESRSLRGRASAAVKQRVRRKQYYQSGPCVLLLWTNTVGPPSGWVPQPGPCFGDGTENDLAFFFDTRKVFFNLCKITILGSGQYLHTLIISVKSCDTPEARQVEMKDHI